MSSCDSHIAETLDFDAQMFWFFPRSSFNRLIPIRTVFKNQKTYHLYTKYLQTVPPEKNLFSNQSKLALSRSTQSYRDGDYFPASFKFVRLDFMLSVMAGFFFGVPPCRMVCDSVICGYKTSVRARHTVEGWSTIASPTVFYLSSDECGLPQCPISGSDDIDSEQKICNSVCHYTIPNVLGSN